MNKLAERVIKEVDGHGFDWWGVESKEFDEVVGNILWFEYQGEKYNYSLADLATNKSFLEALAKFVGIKERLESPAHIKDFSRMIPALARDLQVKLIKDLTFNEGKNFWEICADFIGLEREVCCE